MALALTSVLALVAPGCGSSSPTTPGNGLPVCTLTSQCAPGLFCAIGFCRARCAADVDCGGGGATCVFGTDPATMTKSFFCQAPVDKNKPCASPKDCTAPMACASDYRCRNQCTSDADCNPAGAPLTANSKVCAQDSQGVDYCASPSEVTVSATGTNMITTTPPSGAMTTTMVIEPADASMIAISADAGIVSTSGASTGATSGAASGAGAGSTSGAATGSTSGAATGSATGSTSGAMSGASSGTGKSCGVCANGYACDTTTGMCALCGMNNSPCCPGNPCGSNLTCNAANICECGFANEPCCGGTSCNQAITCVQSDAGAGASCQCGGLGTACCPPAVAGGAKTCLSGGTCEGKVCGCLMDYEQANNGGLVRLVDGTLRKVSGSNNNNQLNGNYQLVANTAGPLKVHSIQQMAVSGYYNGDVGCAVLADGSVWCFPLSDTITDSSYIGSGGGPAMPVSTPQQVWASVDGSTKLSNIVQISGGGSAYANFCAVDASGGVWCWGYGGNGQLGTGDTSNGPYARPVLTNLTTSFIGAAEVQVGYEATCARKTSGTIWCWGQNATAELGVPQSQVQNSYYATQQISITGTATATKLVTGPSQTFCSIMSDTSILCWGYNAYGAAGAPTAGNNTVGPTTVLLGMGMGPLTGVIDVATSNYYTMCAKVATTNTPVFCWGNYSSGPYPAPFKDNQQNPVTGITSPLYGNYQVSLSYVDLNGKTSNAGAPSSWQPTCAGLLSPLADGGP